MGRFKHFTDPPELPLVCPLCGPWRVCEWPSALWIYLSEDRAEEASEVPVLSAGRIGQGKATAPVPIS
jgi:hypothetical protein